MEVEVVRVILISLDSQLRRRFFNMLALLTKLFCWCARILISGSGTFGSIIILERVELQLVLGLVVMDLIVATRPVMLLSRALSYRIAMSASQTAMEVHSPSLVSSTAHLPIVTRALFQTILIRLI